MRLQCGVVLPGGTASEQLEQAVLAERAGWDGVFVWEAAYGVDAWSLLAAMAGRPGLHLLGDTRRELDRLKISKILVSLSHIKTMASAVVIIEK